MREYIGRDLFNEDGNVVGREYSGELIRCKDCRFRDSELACTQFDAYTSAAGDLFMPPDWFYCGYGKRKEE